MASIRGYAHMCVWTISEDSHHGYSCCTMYQSFPWLTAGLRGCAYCGQRLAIVTVSLVRTLSSRRWCLQTFQRNKCRPQIHVVSAQKQAAKKIVAATSDRRNDTCDLVHHHHHKLRLHIAIFVSQFSLSGLECTCDAFTREVLSWLDVFIV